MSLREDLAYAYRIIADMGLDDSTYAHISVRVDQAHFLIMPFGLLFEEVTPECLLLVNLQGEIIEGSEQHYNKTGYAIHGTIYSGRPDISAVYHLHTSASIAVGASAKGLLPISQWALHFYEQVAYGTYDSLIVDEDTQGKKLLAELGDKKVMLMRNHGLLTCGQTLHEALFYIHHLENACRVQAFSQVPDGGWVLPPHEVCQQSCKDLLSFEKDLGKRDWDAYVRRMVRMGYGVEKQCVI